MSIKLVTASEKTQGLGRGLAPEDFYINEQGFLVFTALYHQKRGYCCKNNCKHCAYKNTDC